MRPESSELSGLGRYPFWEGISMEDRTCVIESCSSSVVARGWCGKHYQRWKQTGEPYDVKACPGCGETFRPKGRQEFCSRPCQSRIWQRGRLGIEDPGFIRQCWWCHSDFRFTDSRRDYCSTECAKFGSLLGNIRRLYGVSRDEYRAAYFRQGGLCAICKQPERTERNQLLPVDHDHLTGRFRGLLCSHCNRAIGLLGDDPEIIEAAARYVRESRLII